ncbi:MAG: NAD-dependent epimerase/dehydratase family protein [Lentisphaeraceae bacterium]|nr:NAD-dependent epimerase/dehydratase family protein [Lentisphaeraceae bacterium]
MNKVLITGGAGFIGSNLADALLKQGDAVFVIDNYETGRIDNLTPQENLIILEGSIADADLVFKAFKDFQPDVVVHAAASYKDPENWIGDAETNAAGTAIIAKACKENNVKRLIYFQTALCYGVIPEEQPVTITHPLRPYESSYAISKTAGENYISLSELDFISFRLANAYGPRNLSGPLPTFFHRLSENKKCFCMETRRDFIFINDLVEVVLKAIAGQGESGYYHISSGSDFSIKELFDATIKAMNITLQEEVEIRPRNPDDAFTILLDPSKTNKTFDWEITTSLDTGVAAAINWYKEYGISQTFTHLKAE